MANKVNVSGTPFDSVIASAKQTLAGLSTGAQRNTANQQAAAQLQPQIVAQQNANAQQQTLLGNLYNRQTGFALAMAQLANPNGQAAQNDYLAAANTMGTLGQGITGAVGADWQNAASQASQAAAGMTGGQGAVKGLYDPSGLQSSGYTTGFALPGASLADQAVSAAANARNAQLANANQLGVMAANTQANQAQAATQGAQALAAIRAQQPGIFQSSLQNQQQLHQQAADTLGSLTANQANYLQTGAQMKQSQSQFLATQKQSQGQFVASQLQQAKQFATTSGEQALVDKATIAYNKGQLGLAQSYLGQSAALQAPKIAAANLANRAATMSITGYDPKTGKLAAGWILVNGHPIQYSSYVSSLTAQARLAMYQDRSAGKAADVQSKLVGAATTMLNTGGPGAKGTPPTYTYTPVYNAAGKRISSSKQIEKPGFTPTVVPYNQMLQGMIALNPSDPAWVKQATQMVQAKYPVGTGGRPMDAPDAMKYATQQARNAAKRGVSARQALRTLLGYQPVSSLTQQQLSGIIAQAFTAGGKGSPLYGPPAP